MLSILLGVVTSRPLKFASSIGRDAGRMGTMGALQQGRAGCVRNREGVSVRKREISGF